MQMLLIDALYINNGGGKILLNYLVNKIEACRSDVFYLFDERCLGDYDIVPNQRKLFLKASLLNRNKFYRNNFNNFSKVFCFGNLGPTVKLNIPVFTYFHQTIFFDIPKEFNFNQRIIFKIKSIIFSKLLKNTNFVLVQSNLIKDKLENKYKFNHNNILVVPFYPNEDLKNHKNIREKCSYIYVSSGAPHKNHFRLINVFCRFFDEKKQGKLFLTIDPIIFPELSNLINEKVKQGYPICNLGFIKREQLIKQYNQAEYLIFPSLDESFGLGIVEAIECGCKVIGVDLPYMYQVCQPSIIFNPLDEESIYQALDKSTKNDVNLTSQIIKNEINKLITILK